VVPPAIIAVLDQIRQGILVGGYERALLYDTIRCVGYQRNEIVEDLMAVDPKQYLHALINRLNDDEARALSTILDTGCHGAPIDRGGCIACCADPAHK